MAKAFGNHLREGIIQTAERVLLVVAVLGLPQFILDLEVAQMVAPVEQPPLLALLHLLDLPDEAAASLQSAVALGDEDLGQLERRRRHHVVLDEGAWRRGMALHRDGYRRALLEAALGRLFQVVVRGAVSALVGPLRRSQCPPLDAGQFRPGRIVSVVVVLFRLVLLELLLALQLLQLLLTLALTGLA